MREKVVILYNKISSKPTADELDVLAQVKDVQEALLKLGYRVCIIAFSFDLQEVISQLKEENPDFVFNLVEGMDNDGQLITIAPSILDYLKIPYTGCNKESMFITSNKIVTKEFLKLHNIATAQWVNLTQSVYNKFLEGERYIIKAVWEDASIGLDEDAVVSPKSEEDLINIIREKNKKYKIEFFAERYIHGRDFTISMLAGKQMPISEIVFLSYYSDDKVRVFDYNAKWVKDTPEYDNTGIDFEFEHISQTTIEEMQSIADKCWTLFGLNGYARIDFRVDEQGKPFVLEVNPNPCISKGIMFEKMLKKGDTDYIKAIKIIIDDIKKIY